MIQQTADKWLFICSMHHIISDGWSMDILIKELFLFYDFYLKGETPSLPPLRIQYKDYAAWQQAQLTGAALTLHKEYWLKQFDGELPVLELPTDRARPVIKTYCGGRVNRKLSTLPNQGIRQLVQDNGATLFMGLLASVNALLYRYTGQSDIIIGSPVAGRDHNDLSDQLGFYVNTLALRSRFSGSNNFSELLAIVKNVTLGAYEHQAYPFDELLEELKLQRNMNRHPLFDVMVSLQNPLSTKSGNSDFTDLQVSMYEEVSTYATSKFDLTFSFTDAESELFLEIEYNKDIFDQSAIERMVKHLDQLIETAVSNPLVNIQELNYLSVDEKHQLLVEFNNTTIDYPKGKTIIDLFAEQVKKVPDSIAVVFGTTRLTYGELNNLSGRLALELINEYKIKPGDLIAILMKRSENLIVSILAILKSGAAYIPIDPEYPLERRKFILNDTSAAVLLIDSEFSLDLEYYQGHVFDVDHQLKNLCGDQSLIDQRCFLPKATDKAYVIYTSGSTGLPKGCIIGHESLFNYIQWSNSRYSVEPLQSNFCFFTSLSFDLTVTSIFCSLTKGGTLKIYDQSIELTEVFKDVFSLESGVNCIKLTPSHVNLLQHLNLSSTSMRVAIVGGEELQRDHIRIFQQINPGLKVYNEYGPTESTVGCIVSQLSVNDPIVIGLPISNTQIYILDKQQQLTAIGIIGEICIGGDGLARGYLNRPELTNEKFVPNPFKPGERMYKTGDLGRWLSDGNIEFIGRKDDQVKIRGYRIELGEIENALQNYAGMDAAVVGVKKNKEGTNELVAYVVSKEELNVNDLRTHLSRTLPSYMLPAFYVQLETIPLTNNGKIDRKALPEPEGSNLGSGVEYIAPRTETESMLVKIWEELLDKEGIGVQDDFFMLGGHSLKAIRLLTAIHKQLGIKLKMTDIFTHAQLEAQAEMIERSEVNNHVSIPVAIEQSGYPLSSSQRRLWVLSQFEGGNVAYNMPGVFIFEGRLDKETLQRSFLTLIERHEILRTTFKEDDQGALRQFVQEVSAIDFVLEYEDMRSLDTDSSIPVKIENYTQGAFDLSNGPLLKAKLFQLSDRKYVFGYVMHHIISDGWSMEILIKELLALYNSYVKGDRNPLSPLRIQYKDYAVWQQEELKKSSLSKAKKYWQDQFEGELPLLELPTDFSRPSKKTYRGGLLTKKLNRLVSEGMRELVQLNGATLFMGLLGSVNTLLYRYTGQCDIIIGSPIAGRYHSDLSDQIGFYVNTLAFRSRFSGKDNFKELLSIIREVTLGGYEHEIYPFDELVNVLNLPYSQNRHPLFDVVVNFQSSSESSNLGLTELEVLPYESSLEGVSKFDLTFSFSDTGSDIDLSIEYNSDIYESSTVSRLCSHLEGILSAIVRDPQIPLGDLDYLSNSEKAELLAPLRTPSASYPEAKTIVELFEDQVKKTPSHVALVFEEKSLSYQSLNALSNQLARYLQEEYAIHSDDLVGIELERSEWQVISMLGILKSGGGYVPLDTSYPENRLQYMKSDSNCKVVVDAAELIKFEKVRSKYSQVNLKTRPKPLDLAYVIYTSGTTGQPKGALIDHVNVVRLFKTDPSLFDFTSSDVWTLFHSYCFDFSVWEIYGALFHGGKLVIIPPLTAKDPSLFVEVLVREGVTVLNQTPSSFYNIISQVLSEESRLSLSLRYVIFGGEALSPQKLKSWKDRYGGVKLINMYGITETTVHVTYKEIGDLEIASNSRNIGKAIPTLSCYVLDDQKQLQPYGVYGELYVGGKGVCRGYLNKPALTAERFVSNPFDGSERLYRTGDKVRLLSSGELEYEGRIDEQVKIRGHRIELGEIENALRLNSQIEDCVVLVKSDDWGDKNIIAYVKSRVGISVSEIRQDLSKHLPGYMLPSYYVQLDTLPLTENGKLDRKSLPDHHLVHLSSGIVYEPAVSAEEIELSTIWKEVLERSEIGVQTSFFELGGDSMKVLRMVSLVKTRMGLSIPIALVYEHSTIRELLDNYSGSKNELEKENASYGKNSSALASEFMRLKLEVLSSEVIVNKEDLEDVYPMSDVEKGMVYESLVHQDLGIFHDQMVRYKKFVDFDVTRFQRALELLVEKHSILRTSFNMNDFETELQLVYKKIEVNLHREDLSQKERSVQERCIEAFLKEELKNPFDFSQAPLWRMSVFHLGNDDYVFVFQCHHAIIDGWSDSLFTTELNNLYLALKDNDQYKPLKLKSSYKDYIIDQELGKRDESVRTFWKEELSGFTRLDIFTEVSVNDHYSKFLDGVYLQQLEKFARAHQTTVKTLSLSAYMYLLKLLNYSNDVVAGLVSNGRPALEDSDKVLGCFLNTLPLRLEIEEGQSSIDFVSAVDAKLLNLKKNEKLSLIEITSLHDVQLKSSNPFYDTLFNYIDFHIYDSIITEGSEKKVVEEIPFNAHGSVVSNSLFALTIDTTGGSYGVTMQLLKKFKCGFSLEKIGDLYIKILNHIISSPQSALGEINYLSEAEQQQLLVEFNDTARDYPKDKTIVDLFEAQVKKTPDKIAVVFADKQISYKELNEQANQLGNYLRKKHKIKPDDLIGIKQDMGEWMIISILGILKSGGAYVPIDMEYPLDRIEYIVADSKCKVVIDKEEILKFKQVQQKYAKGNLSLTIQEINLAYVIYTSGSSGNPKGVLIEHGNLVHSVMPRLEVYKQIHSFLLLSSVAFDSSIAGIFGTLTCGGSLHLIKMADVTNTNFISTYVVENKISHLLTVPTYYRILQEELVDKVNYLEAVIVAGETCLSELVSRHQTIDSLKRCDLFNEYGPTECSVWSSFYKYEKGQPFVQTIGKPISNTQIYILDNKQKLVTIGVIGEICIGGGGLARGYLNRPELTNEKFVPNPFKPGERMYKTGDLGRWLSDGNIEFIGRKDDQVKIRGYRIELGEIESVLQSYAGITASVVIAKRTKEGNNELVAYIVSDKELNVSDVRSYLSQSLPVYMLPGYYVQLEQLPLTSNGKIDRKSLPDPSWSALGSGVEYIAPRNETELMLTKIWEEVLGVDRIGIKDDFFMLGGHSLKMIRLLTAIHKQLGVKLKMADIFTHAQLEAQAEMIVHSEVHNQVSIPVASEQSGYPLSSSQRRLWVLSQFEGGNTAYNIPGVFIFEGQLDKETLQRSFLTLIERHEILRTIFKEDEKGEIRQFVHEVSATGFVLGYEDMRSLDTDSSIPVKIENYTQGAFDLSNGPLLKAKLFQVTDTRYVFAYVMHHIISDGWSMEILIKELLALYNSYVKGESNPLSPLRIQYKDYAVWQQDQLSGVSLINHKEYWLNQFEGELPVLELPLDKVRPVIKSYRGGRVSRKLSTLSNRGIRSMCQEEGMTLFMGLLASVNVLLYRYSGQGDIIIGSPIAGRDHSDLNDQIGFYVNTLALRTRFSGSNNFRELLGIIKEVTLGAYEHQVYPFDELVDGLSLQRNLNRHPLFDVMITFQNTALTASGNEGLTNLEVNVYKDASVHTVSKFDLSFAFTDTGSELFLEIQYNSDIYNSSTIERLAVHLDGLMKALVSNPLQDLQQLDYLSSDEKQQLLVDFNGTEKDYPKESTIIELFEEQVKKTPEKIALVFADKQISYKELNKLSNQFGSYLRKHYKIKPDDRIGIKLERSEWMIISILAVLKSGGAYVPIDPDYPQERVDYMISDSQCKIVIDEKEKRKFKKEQKIYSVKNLKAVNKPTDLVYVIYTSGSTGKPKGVMINHKALIDYSFSILSHTNIRECSSFGLVSTIAADLGNTVIYPSLLIGGSLNIFSKNDVMDPNRMLNVNLDCLKIVPSHWKALQQENNFFAPNKCLIFGGEQLTYDVIDILKSNKAKCNIYNHYGPSEATIGKLVKHIDMEIEDIKISLGSPFGNTQIYILDDCQKIVPIGVMGEIYISGAGLALGYLNRPELTAEKFISNPFRAGEKMYKTGDLGRWLSDGNVEFFGRKDNQVKIHGYRIELDEIEHQLLGYEPIDAVSVLVHSNDNGTKELVAYFVSKVSLDTLKLRNYLTRKLPSFMIPTSYVELESMPLTLNGKLDKGKLPVPEKFKSENSEYVKPRNAREKKIASLWQEILGLEEIGINDDFFKIGGNSINAITAMFKMKREFLPELTLEKFFSSPTIAELLNLKSDKDSHANSVIWLNEFDSKLKNVYLIPPVIGTSLVYKAMAERFNSRANFIALQMKGIADGGVMSSCIEDAAFFFSKLITQIQGKEPFIILGWSFGSYIAFELTKILEKNMNLSFKLVLIDSPVSHHKEETTDEEKKQVANEFINASKDRFNFLTEEETKLYERVVRNNYEIIYKYKVQGNINTAVLGLEAKDNIFSTELHHWQSFTTKQCVIKKLPGNHVTILDADPEAFDHALLDFINNGE